MAENITLETVELTQASEDADILFRRLAQASEVEILREITQHRLSNEGDLMTLRHRLLRFGLRQTDIAPLVRWDPKKDELGETPRTRAKRSAKKSNSSLKTRRPTLKRDVKSKYKRNPSDSGGKKKETPEKIIDILRRQPSGSGVKGLKSSGWIQEVATSSVPTTTTSATAFTTTVTTTSPSTTTADKLMFAGINALKLYVSNTLQRFQSEWMIKYANLTTPGRMSPCVAPAVAPSTNIKVSRESVPRNEHEPEDRPRTRSIASQTDEGSSSGSGDDTSWVTENESESHLRRENRRSRKQSNTEEQMEELRQMWEAIRARDETGTQLNPTETVIQSQGGRGIIDTPRPTKSNKKRSKKTNFRLENFSRGIRESTRRDDVSSESEEDDTSYGRRSMTETSSEEEEDMGFLKIKTRPDRRRNTRREARGNREAKAAKHLKTWGIRFANDGRDDPQEFLDDLAACQKAEGLGDNDILDAIYGTFSGEAKLWYRNEQHGIDSLKQFKKAFRKRYMKIATQERLEEDLRGRKQGKDEDIDTFISCIKRILSEFKRPPSLQKQITIIFKNLKKDYRHYMAGKEITRVDDIVKLGREYEKLLEWDTEDANPRPAEKMIVKSAAYRPKKSTSKVAVAQEKEAVESVEPPKNETNKKKKKSEKTKKSPELAVMNEQTKSTKTEEQKLPEKESVEPKKEDSIKQLIDYLKEIGLVQRGNPRREDTRNNQARVVKEQRSTTAQANQAFTCFVCNEPGHRAFECPTRQCFICQQPGHLANRCPTKKPTQTSTGTQRFTPRCAWCGESGVRVSTCPTCSPILRAMGNGTSGASGPRNSE